MARQNVQYVTRNGIPIILFDEVNSNGVTVGGSIAQPGDISITQQQFEALQSDPNAPPDIDPQELSDLNDELNATRWQLMTVLSLTEAQVDLILKGPSPITDPNPPP